MTHPRGYPARSASLLPAWVTLVPMPMRPASFRPSRPATPRAIDPRQGSTARGYGHAWQVGLRAQVMREEPLCRACLADGITTRAEHVDHIVAKIDGGADERSNLQGLCRRHHAIKTAEETRRRRAGTRGDEMGSVDPNGKPAA
jgi:5-methylcytosine-specific restriction protein A